MSSKRMSKSQFVTALAGAQGGQGAPPQRARRRRLSSRNSTADFFFDKSTEFDEIPQAREQLRY